MKILFSNNVYYMKSRFKREFFEDMKVTFFLRNRFNDKVAENYEYPFFK